MKKFLNEHGWILIWFVTFYVGSLLITSLFLGSMSTSDTVVCGEVVYGNSPDYMLYFKALTSAFGIVILLALGVYVSSVFLSKCESLDGVLYWFTGDETFKK